MDILRRDGQLYPKWNFTYWWNGLNDESYLTQSLESDWKNNDFCNHPISSTFVACPATIKNTHSLFLPSCVFSFVYWFMYFYEFFFSDCALTHSCHFSFSCSNCPSSVTRSPTTLAFVDVLTHSHFECFTAMRFSGIIMYFSWFQTFKSSLFLQVINII